MTPLFLLRILIVSAALAGWQSGYAAACKAVDAGSIPTPASIYSSSSTAGINPRSELPQNKMPACKSSGRKVVSRAFP